MKRTIELYIDGKRADLDASGLILMNYAFTDLEKPTAVKNSYSKQITLPGTPANDAIFGHFARTDRRIEAGGSASGVAFNPGFKTPFIIYNEIILACFYFFNCSVLARNAGRVLSPLCWIIKNNIIIRNL